MNLFRRRSASVEPPFMRLWDAIVAEARNPEWYLRHDVPDTIDGRFDMVALVSALVMLRFEHEGLRQEGVWLTERFVEDMDGSLREIGVGDLVVGKHVGNMVGALGGRLGAYRAALAPDAAAGQLEAALARNIYRREPSACVPDTLRALAEDVQALWLRIGGAELSGLKEGRF
ncbi:MAG: ubiquinol-cytochrome C chaperone family protein [Thermaurantiacus sp.]